MLYPQRSFEVKILVSKIFQNAVALGLPTNHDFQNESRTGGPVRGVSPDRAMAILDELEEDDESVEPKEPEGGKPKVTKDNQDGQDKTATEAGGAQHENKKASEEKQGSKDLSASKSSHLRNLLGAIKYSNIRCLGQLCVENSPAAV